MFRILIFLFGFCSLFAGTSLNQMVLEAASYHEKGEFSKAEKIYLSVLDKDPDHFHALRLLGDIYKQSRAYDKAVPLFEKCLEQNPYTPDALYSLGEIALEKKNLDKAIDYFQKVMIVYPDHPQTQKHFLDALTLSLGSKENSKHKRLLLGIGTGRCGSTSLTMLWKAQKDSVASHESPPRMPWEGNKDRLDFHKKRWSTLLEKYQFVGEVSHWWLNYFEDIVLWNPNVRVVVLKRDREKTIDSFYRMKGKDLKGTINHWVYHNGTYYSKTFWDECYPKYDSRDLKDALGKYWDEYYEVASELAKRYPKNIRIFDMEDLNSEKKQLEILEFCGFEEPKTVKNLHYNKGTVDDGEFLF